MVDGGLFVQYPVEDGIGEYGIEGGIEMEVGGGHHPEVEIGVGGVCAFDHGLGLIDADDAGAGLGDQVGEVAGAATEVEDPFSLTGVKELDDVLTEFEDKVVFVVVEVGVPFCIVVVVMFVFLIGPGEVPGLIYFSLISLTLHPWGTMGKTLFSLPVKTSSK
jgi:hypothetical protein